MIDTVFVKTRADSSGSADLTHAVNDVLDRLRVNGEYPVAVQVIDISPEVDDKRGTFKHGSGQTVTLCVTLQHSTEEER